jgi:2,3-bisphosphoglycerate-dependent phosphoglycerate mutase
MIRIGFIRHGATEWNLLGRMQGQTDIPLAAVGKEQAALLAGRLLPGEWDGIVSSDLIRAAETAEILADGCAIPYWGSDPRLRERGFGELEGTTLEERISRWGENWRELMLGRESLEVLLARWDSFVDQRAGAMEGKRILMVSHGGFIEPVLANRYGTAMQSHLDNASLSVFVFETAGWRCDLLNCTRHLV